MATSAPRLRSRTTTGAVPWLKAFSIRLLTARPSGPRLKRHFRQADRDQNHRLNRQEAKLIPWISRNFNALDGDRDGSVTLEELWNHQRSLAPSQRRPLAGGEITRRIMRINLQSAPSKRMPARSAMPAISTMAASPSMASSSC